jgi:hypothetical protein
MTIQGQEIEIEKGLDFLPTESMGWVAQSV